MFKGKQDIAEQKQYLREVFGLRETPPNKDGFTTYAKISKGSFNMSSRKDNWLRSVEDDPVTMRERDRELQRHLDRIKEKWSR